VKGKTIDQRLTIKTVNLLLVNCLLITYYLYTEVSLPWTTW